MVQQEVLGQISDPRLRPYVVWLPRVPGDARPVAEKSQALVSDTRARQFWDGRGTTGHLFSRAVELPRSKKFAWDVYFVFGPRQSWREEMPRPVEWMHQLAKDERRLDGGRLRSIVRERLGEQR